MKSTSILNNDVGVHGSFIGCGNRCVICNCGRPVWWYIEMPPICPWCLRDFTDKSQDRAHMKSRSELKDLVLRYNGGKK